MTIYVFNNNNAGGRRAVEKAGPWKARKTKNRFSSLPTALGNPANPAGFPLFPQPRLLLVSQTTSGNLIVADRKECLTPVTWYCSEPRLAFNRIVVVRYRMYLESRHLAANTINQQLAAVRRLAHEAADSGLLSPELAAGISRVKGVKQLGFRSGNWLSAEQSSEVLKHAYGDTMRARRDYAMLAMLFGCGFRRSELVGLELDEIQMRQGHWAVVDLIGKGGHIRTVPIPEWVKAALDQWTAAARVTEGRIFRAVARMGKVWGKGISQNVVWYVVKSCCERAGLEHIAPHDLRSYAESRIMPNRV